jgi:hypothetical protein
MLKDLAITGFRGFESLKIDHLGGVNLILGMNGVGKTSLLEAIWLYSAPMNHAVVRELLAARHEFRMSGTGVLDLHFESLFFGGREPKHFPLDAEIGPITADRGRTAKFRYSLHNFPVDRSSGGVIYEIKDENGNGSHFGVPEPLPAFSFGLGNSSLTSLKGSFHPSILSEDAIDEAAPFLRFSSLDFARVADWWSAIALTDAETRVTDLLRLIAPVERVAIVAPGFDETEYGVRRRGRFLVRLKGSNNPQSLTSLGDGVERVFHAALAIEFARHQSGKMSDASSLSRRAVPFAPGWCALIDEIDSGIHYSILESYWDAIFGLAAEMRVQVFATTHSRECIEAFQKAAARCTDVEGVAIRLEKCRNEIKAFTISEEDLSTVVDAGIEIR